MGNAPSGQEKGTDAIDPRVVERLESRAQEMAAKIDELEKRLKDAASATVPVAAPTAPTAPSPAATPSSAQITATYVRELQSLRGVLVTAEKEHQELLGKVSALEEANAKLQYRIMHLKRNCASEA